MNNQERFEELKKFRKYCASVHQNLCAGLNKTIVYENVYRRESFPYQIDTLRCLHCGLQVDIDESPNNEIWVINELTTLNGVHEKARCMGETCTLHRPRKHHMIHWPLIWRADRGIFERLCPHGIGHHDPDTYDQFDSQGIHGCDGCCAL